MRMPWFIQKMVLRTALGGLFLLMLPADLSAQDVAPLAPNQNANQATAKAADAKESEQESESGDKVSESKELASPENPSDEAQAAEKKGSRGKSC
jgi:hypothetical protein